MQNLFNGHRGKGRPKKNESVAVHRGMITVIKKMYDDIILVSRDLKTSIGSATFILIKLGLLLYNAPKNGETLIVRSKGRPEREIIAESNFIKEKK